MPDVLVSIDNLKNNTWKTTYQYPPVLKRHNNIVKGGLISESFSLLWLYPLKDVSWEILFEIFLPLNLDYTGQQIVPH